VVIDFNSGLDVQNYPPRIKSLASDANPVIIGMTARIFCTAEDKDNDQLVYNWTFPDSVVHDGGASIDWMAPQLPGDYNIKVIVDDTNISADSSVITLQVVEAINHDPVIDSMKAKPRKIDLGSTSSILCSASDADGDQLTYTWSADSGVIEGQGEQILWTAPDSEGNYFITCMVSDGQGGVSTDSIGIVVRDFSDHEAGNLIMHIRFDGNADDISGNGYNGTVNGARLTTDRLGNSNSAYSFDGENDNILVANNPQLNFSEAISVNFWMKVDEFFDREAYPISHGNWENRWKASITEHGLRWTVKTSDGIKDLDSETPVPLNEFINITLYYSPPDIELYFNGKLNAFGSFTGNLLSTTHDLTICQALPNNSSYNFKGTIDDVRLYDYGLSVDEIENLYRYGTPIEENRGDQIPSSTYLYQNYPNPFNSQTRIKYTLHELAMVELTVFDMLGRKIRTLIGEHQSPGRYYISWDSKDDQGIDLSSGVYFIRLKTDNHINTRKIVLIQ
jgi:hypothetical protein